MKKEIASSLSAPQRRQTKHTDWYLVELPYRQHRLSSELHGVSSIVLGESETSTEVLLDEGSLVSGKVLDESVVDGLLEVSTFN